MIEYLMINWYSNDKLVLINGIFFIAVHIRQWSISGKMRISKVASISLVWLYRVIFQRKEFLYINRFGIMYRFSVFRNGSISTFIQQETSVGDISMQETF